MNSSGGTQHSARAKPCATCPWRKDAEIGRFPPLAYMHSANTTYDAAMSTFACHESGQEKPATCAGFLTSNSMHNIGVRLSAAAGKLDLNRDYNPDKVDLYESYRAMAIANGVPEDHPSIAPCRGDDEDYRAVHERLGVERGIRFERLEDAGPGLRKGRISG